jgi:hypothetical protein
VEGEGKSPLKVLDHPAHSPELAPSDFHLFWHLKKRQKSHKDEEVKMKSLHSYARRQWRSVTSEYKNSHPGWVNALTKVLIMLKNS